MIVLKNINKVNLKNTAVAIGMFDGLHLGHLEIIKQLKKSHLTSCVLSFDTSELSILKKQKIITDNKKRELLNDFGIDYYIFPKFAEIKNISAANFVTEFLAKRVDCKIVVVGNDFRFGFDRIGDIKLLGKLLEKHNKKLAVVKTQFLYNKRISSSNIRQYIKNGDVKSANAMLGRNLSLDFEIIGYIDNCLIQEIKPEFVSPPDGRYLSLVEINGKKTETQTVICDFNKKKCAKTSLKINYSDNYFKKIFYNKDNKIRIEITEKIQQSN